MVAFAFALNKTFNDLKQQSASGSGNLMEDSITLTTKNSVFVERMFQHLQNTSFAGLSGKTVQFDEDGIREINVLDMVQYQWNNSEIDRVIVGEIRVEESLVTHYLPPFSHENPGMWPDGIPNDGIPIENVVTVSVPLTVVYVALAVGGLVFAIVCVFFTVIFRKRKLIRLSSPNLNYLIGLGAIILYFNVITLVIPTTDTVIAAILCNINPWLTSLGYSLCYGTILAKTIRIWFIFNKPRVPSVTKSIVIKDYALALFVVSLVVIDVIILGIFAIVEGLRGELAVHRTSNKENIEDTIGPTCEFHQYYLYICKSKGQVALFTVLFGYKGLLQVTALILAFNTRKVKVKGLDDSKYIAAAIYVTSIVLAVAAISTYTLRDYVNIYPAVVGIGFLLGTTMILGLVFVPRMVGLYQDPQGDNIKISNSHGSHDVPRRDSAYSPDAEIRRLKQRISELEKNIQPSQMFPMGTTVSVSNPDYMASSPSAAERYQNHQLHICASSHDSTRDNPLTDTKRNVVRWSDDHSPQTPL
uniref:Metabotropic glutamate GABA-like receptor n=1 Tax=Geodia cydonium TaxID=6047 RepID=O96954_GEOCY|nr:metabotropic glutamate GABA-like receptor [Geodia cydonium]